MTSKKLETFAFVALNHYEKALTYHFFEYFLPIFVSLFFLSVKVTFEKVSIDYATTGVERSVRLFSAASGQRFYLMF